MAEAQQVLNADLGGGGGDGGHVRRAVLRSEPALVHGVLRASNPGLILGSLGTEGARWIKLGHMRDGPFGTLAHDLHRSDGQ